MVFATNKRLNEILKAAISQTTLKNKKDRAIYELSGGLVLRPRTTQGRSWGT